MNDSSIGASQNSPVIQNPVSQQQMPKRRLAPQRPSGRSVTVETDNIPNSNTPVSNKADFPKSAWTSAKVSDRSKARFGQDGSTQIGGHRHELVQEQRAITSYSVKLAQLEGAKQDHKDAIAHLDSAIAKAQKAAKQILQSPTTRRNIKQSLEQAEAAKAKHEQAIQNLEKQASGPSLEIKKLEAKSVQRKQDEAAKPVLQAMPKAWTFKLENGGSAPNLDVMVMPKTPQELFVKGSTVYLESRDAETFGAVLKDFGRGAEKLKISDERTGSQSSGISYDGRQRLEEIKTAKGLDKQNAAGIVLKEELTSLGAVMLSPDDQKVLGSLLDKMSENWGSDQYKEKVGQELFAAKNQFSGNTDNFFRTINVLRTATRLDILMGIAQSVPVPPGIVLKFPTPLEAGNYPYTTSLKRTDQGTELTYSVFVTARRESDGTLMGACPLNVTYAFDNNMNLVALNSEPGQFEFNPK